MFCKNLPELGIELDNDGYYDAAFDTVRYFVKHCVGLPNADEIFGALGECNGLATLLKGEPGQIYFRNYLISILYLNPRDAWYCADIREMVHSFKFDYGYPAALGLTKWLIDNPRCGDASDAYSYWLMRKGEYTGWLDSVTVDTTKYPFDTTILTLHQMGLDTLLSSASVTHYSILGPQIIADARLTSNPFKSETSLSLSIDREAYLHIEVLDLLGRKLAGAGFEGVFEPGSRIVPLKMESVPSGTYYVRISTANNELRTIKIEKKE